MEFQNRSGMRSPSTDPGSDSDCEGSVVSKAQRRKSNKPLLEKKRRARINQSLEQLKGLVLEALKKDSARYSKLEKADILEMTVKHLRDIQRHQMSVAMSVDPSVVDKFRAGFSECAQEVQRYLSTIDGMSPEVRLRLMQHLASCASQQHQQAPYPAMSVYNPAIPAASAIHTLPGMSMRTPLPFGGLAMSSPEVAAIPAMLKSNDFRLSPQGIVPKTEAHVIATHSDNSENIAPSRHQRPLAEKTNNENVHKRHNDRNNNSVPEVPAAKRVKMELNLDARTHHKYPNITSGCHRDNKLDQGLLELNVKMEPVWRPW